MRPARPVRPLPALLATTTRSRAPCACSASMSSSGAPTAPKPAHRTVTPSRMSATAASRLPTVLSIMISEGDPVAALEFQDVAGLRRTGDLEREIFQDRADAADLIGI